jgi:hypothetical protein
MPRLIDADALRRYLLDEYHGVISDSEIKIYQLIRLLNEQPTIDPERHGRWTWYENRSESTTEGPAECQEAGYCCSECRADLSEYLSGALNETVYADNALNVPKIHFCPNCGALVDGEARG